MAISRELIDQIRDRTDIVEVVGQHVTLRRRGSSYMGLCPFHQEKTPSFSVVPHKGIFHCFGCGEGGDVFKFLMKVQGLDFVEAVKQLAGPAGITIEERLLTPDEQRKLKTRATLHDVCEAAAQYYHTLLVLKPQGEPGRRYLAERGINSDTIQSFRIGYAPEGWSNLQDYIHSKGFSAELAVKAGLARRSERGHGTYDVFRNRIVFPIFDAHSRVVSFGGRLLPGADSKSKGSPKYLNGPETEIYNKTSLLYGLSHARASIQRQDRVLLVEGYFDVVSLAQAGFTETVATCGTSLTPEHTQVIRRLTRTVVALFDTDDAGIRAAVRSMTLLADADMEALRLLVPNAKDPDEYIQVHGAEAFERLLEKTTPLMEVVIQHEASRWGASPVGKKRTLESLAPLISRFPPITRAGWVHRIADLLYLPEAQVAHALSRRVERPTSRPVKQPSSISREVKHLFWLIIHHTDKVAPSLRSFDPAWVSERHDVRDCLGALLSGRPVADVMERATDQELRRIIGGAAAESDLYQEERASRAAGEILARLELKALRQQLASIHQELSTCNASLDRTRYSDLIARRVALHSRLKELHALISA